MSKLVVIAFAVALLSECTQAQEVTGQLNGLVEITATNTSEQKSWLRQGWGVTRFDADSDVLGVSRAVLSGRMDFSSAWSAHAVAQYVPEPDHKLGFTEAYIQYQPLAQGYQFSARIGGFYPRMSLENPAIGWSSPYTLHYSGLNAWLAEEIRTFGAEFELKRAARRFRSKHDVSFVGALFKGNDPAGTLIAWRGFIPHDRQSVFNERVAFARVKSLYARQLRFQGQYVEPFSEIDGRFGYYVGVHWSYLKRHSLRAYWYDNNGDPGALNYTTKQYAWDSKFWSLAWRSKVSSQTQFIAQALYGNTAMGPRRGVNNDFYSWYAMLSHTFSDYRVSGRVEQSKVMDKDTWTFDPNASLTNGVTLNVSKTISEAWQVGAEFQFIDYEAQSRPVAYLPLGLSEQVWRISAQYQF
ncbi:hypothetical protein [Pseudoalteromonas byunsanensis]|uniref:Porin n=2 Tax=Pseudoalteromonas byunsanensis TaxID=327939 RepID=A0A1S1NDJ8_9GAMM|nr:hypothetical protein [Pseudoalteromonas byunsanensis]OHU97909.1 hypothetical protein BIW53_00610 [Pseudoalteromonas byunsanensis]